MDECLYCHHVSVLYDGESTLEELGYDGKGIISFYHCTNCNSEYLVKTEQKEEAPE